MFIVCQRRWGLSDDEETRLASKKTILRDVILFFGCKNQIMVAVTKRFESGPIKSRVGPFPDVFGVTA